MWPLTPKSRLLILIGILLLGGLAFSVLWWNDRKIEEPSVPPAAEVAGPRIEEIGRSVEGRPINSYTYGTGDTHLLFVGGIHGGYEWNSVLLSYQFIDHLATDPKLLPAALTVTIVPVANPDGLYTVVGQEGRFDLSDVPAGPNPTGRGRLNARGVDINRNFDCKWQPESSWQGKVVSAGATAFSEPEAAALRDWILNNSPAAAIFWHSQANSVYGSECTQGILPGTLALMNAYATAAGYAAVPAFTSYPITGDAEGWLASIGIPAITVELKTHETVEWEQNVSGIKALISYFTN